MVVHYFFKIFNNIKSDHESEIFAKLELESLFGDIQPVLNVVDLCNLEPFSDFLKEPNRIQDAITTELPYGQVQGYSAKRERLEDISKLVYRLAYTREIYLVTDIKGKSNEELISSIFPIGILNKNIQAFQTSKYLLFRIITNQYFLEKSQYISKLSRKFFLCP